MIPISSTTSLVEQSLKTIIRTPQSHTLLPLLKIAAVKNTNESFSHRGNLNRYLDKSASTQINLAEKFKRTIKDFQVHQEKIIDKYNISSDSGIFAENNNFRLAKSIDQLIPHSQASLNNIDRLIIFGDSLSDSDGRMYEKSLHLIPSYSQYYQGRFTNGFVWGEYLSSPAFLDKKMVNFAEGGSSSASYSPLTIRSNFLSNLDHQIKGYQPSGKDLVLIFAGANDYMTLDKKDILKVVESQIDSVEKLLEKGAKNILVMGMPDISLSPDAQESKNKREYKDIAIAHNYLLDKNIDELKEKYPQGKIFFFDTSGAFKEIISIANEIGYDTTHAYSEHGYIHIPMKTDPAINILPEYLYNDGVHPTQEVHQTFAAILNNFIIDRYADKSEPK